MGRVGCTMDGSLDQSKFSEPIPWIGGYVAAASAACAMAMAADAAHGFRHRKFWFPCKFFSLNATTLTLVAVSIKLSVDLNTSMPRRQDQLTKLSSSVFICTVMGNSLPSIAAMNYTEMIMNIMALGILVITAIVNIGIQLGTGVIYTFWKEHAVVMLLMLILLAIMISSALTVPTTKCYFDLKYKTKYKLAMKEWPVKNDKPVMGKLREGLEKYWMMAHTCSPQFVMGRLATCTASGAFCLLGALALAEAMLRSFFMPWSVKFCSGDSDYEWSIPVVLITQTIAVVVGTMAPAARWFVAVKFRCSKNANKARQSQFTVENYWIRKLLQWRECPFALRIGGRQGRKFAHKVKNWLVDFCIAMQTVIVLVSKFVCAISIFFTSRFLIFSSCWKRLRCSGVSRNDAELDSQPSLFQAELKTFILHLEGEEQLVDLMMGRNCDATDHWIRMGKRKQPKHLLQLLQKHTSSREFKGVLEFDDDQIPCLDSEEPPNSWALPVVTLTSIAIALPNVDHHLTKELIRSVNEGLVYVRLVENKLDTKGNFTNSRKAAEIVWLGTDLHHRWLDEDLRKISLEAKTPKEVLQLLADNAKNSFMELKQNDAIACLKVVPSKWPIKVLAANSMYRLCRTLLLDYENKGYQSSKILVERLSAMISDILGACLTNLPRVISLQCDNSSIEEREESVRCAIVLLGKTENILKILDQQSLSCSDPYQLGFIDGWRIPSKQKVPRCYMTSSADGNNTSSSSPDMCLTIE